MTIREWAEFTADFPEDHLERDGHIVVYGGRNVAEAIGELLRGLGFQVQEVEDAGLNGWRFSASIQQIYICCQISDVPPVHILGIWEEARFKGLQDGYTDLLNPIAEALAADGRFHDIVWRTSKEMDVQGSAGAPLPVIDEPAEPIRPWWKRMLGLN